MGRNFKKMISTCSVALVVMVISLGWVPFRAMAADTIKIGCLDSFSGPLESVGRFFTAGFQFAVDEQNEKGGLFGKKIEVVYEDSEFKGDVANRKAKKLIMDDKVDILASGGSSSVAIALNKLSADYKKLYIYHAALSDDVQGKEFSRYGFRVCNSMYNIYAAMALFMANKPYRKFYILAPDWSTGYDTNRVFKAQMKIHVPDAKMIGEDYHPMNTKDFGPYITKIIAAKPDAVLLGSFGPDLYNCVKTARSMGLKTPILSHVIEPYPMYQMKDDGVGIHITTPYSIQVKTPENEEMVRKYHEKHKNDKDYQTWWPCGQLAGAIIGWKMAFAAFEKTGSLDPEKVISVFEGFQYKSPVGLWTMRKCDHQAIMPFFGVVMAGGANPYFNGSIRSDVNFPWEGSNIDVFPAEKVALPATPDYNSRCP